MFDWKFLIVFIGLSLFNVIFSTVRSLLTINGGKTTASIVSGAYYAFYNIMIIYTVADFPMWQKCALPTKKSAFSIPRGLLINHFYQPARRVL